MLLDQIYKLPMFVRRSILIILDSILLFISLLLSYINLNNFNIFIYLFLWTILLSTYLFTGHYRSILRYYDNLFVYKIISRNIITIIVFRGLGNLLKINAISELNFIVLIILNIFFSLISRLFIRDIIYLFKSIGIKNKKNIIIYGAGSAGSLLLKYLNETGKFNIISFVDDNNNLVNRQIGGITIRATKDLPLLIKKNQVKTIILAIPSLGINRRRILFKSIQNLDIELLKVPEIEEITLDNANIKKLKPIKIEDLLYREVVKADVKLMQQDIKDSSICVTGAGGSIGSELCRQILNLKPEKIVLMDNSEFNLFQIEQELKNKNIKNIKIIACLIDVKNYEYVLNIFKNEKVNIVFHASAYKHVPLVESNPFESILNNIKSSKTICLASIECNVKKAILISSDKAVRPSSIMGVTKRLSELIFQAYNEKEKNSFQKEGRTIFAMVRFGNVLNSSGSVIQTFKKQIEDGGPLTITDKKMIRYFMTIEEASQLVIQSSSIAKGGEVFLLDMGEPVKIIDLANQMINLSGLTVKNEKNIYGDIEIVETGLRKGEKLYEELLIDGKSEKTKHPLIFCAEEKKIFIDQLNPALEKIDEALKEINKKKLFKILKEIVPEWKYEI